jgi:hypothetical protein
MKLQNLFEDKKMLAVVYGGRFQPFHKGHMACYKHLCDLFGVGPVWIATSNRTNLDPADGDISPLNFDERREVMTQMFNIPYRHIIQCKNPAFSPIEVLAMYNGPTVLVVVCGKKDIERYAKTKGFRPYPTKAGKPVNHQHLLTRTGPDAITYYYVSEAIDGEHSGTDIRNAFMQADTKVKQKALMKKIYGHYDADICELLVGKFKDIKPAEQKDE